MQQCWFDADWKSKGSPSHLEVSRQQSEAHDSTNMAFDRYSGKDMSDLTWRHGTMHARTGTTLTVLIYDKWRNSRRKHGRNEVFIFSMRRHHPKIKIPWKHWGVVCIKTLFVKNLIQNPLWEKLRKNLQSLDWSYYFILSYWPCNISKVSEIDATHQSASYGTEKQSQGNYLYLEP